MAPHITHGLGRWGTAPISFSTMGFGAYLFHQIAPFARSVGVALSERWAEVRR